MYLFKHFKNYVLQLFVNLIIVYRHIIFLEFDNNLNVSTSKKKSFYLFPLPLQYSFIVIQIQLHMKSMIVVLYIQV